MTTTRNEMKKAGICVKCGKRPVGVDKNGKKMNMCEICAEREKERRDALIADRLRIFSREEVDKCLNCDIPAKYCTGDNCERARRHWEKDEAKNKG